MSTEDHQTIASHFDEAILGVDGHDGGRDAVDGTAVGSRGIGSSSADTGVSSTLLRSANRPVLVIPSAALPHPQDS